MEVDRKLIRNIASLARLKLTGKEEEMFAEDFKTILEAFSAVDDVDTEGLDISFQPVEMKDMTREDHVEKSLSQEEALANTKHKKDGYFKGPKAV